MHGGDKGKNEKLKERRRKTDYLSDPVARVFGSDY